MLLHVLSRPFPLRLICALCCATLPLACASFESRPRAGALVIPSQEEQQKERDAFKTSGELNVDFLNKISPPPGNGGGWGGGGWR